MAKFHLLKISDVKKETDDCVSVAFEIPDNLKNDYKFIQGQYLTIKVNINNEELRRSYSICSCPINNEPLRVAIKKVKDGRVSTYINEKIKKGDSLEVMTPMGNFHSPISASNKKNYVLFAGGSGITPMLSIIKTVLIAEPQSSLMLFYGNRDNSSIIFKNELETLSLNNPERLNIHHILENAPAGYDSLHTGLLTKEKAAELISNFISSGNNEYFICGPTPMMDNVKLALENAKADSSKIHIEYFNATTETPKTSKNNGAVINSSVTIIIDDQESVVELSSNGKTILDAAIDLDLDVPFACKGAVCCTCRAKIMEGTATMDANYALTDSEVEQGYILTCQAHPTSEKLVVSYDEP